MNLSISLLIKKITHVEKSFLLKQIIRFNIKKYLNKN